MSDAGNLTEKGFHVSTQILAIDLEPDAELRLKQPLVKSGYDVDLVTSEIEIISKAKKSNCGVILFNPALRNSNDFETLRELIEIAKHKGAVVMIVSSSSDRARIQKSITLGAVDYLVVPFLPNEIVSRVEKNIPIQFDWNMVREFLNRLNMDEPRILETPFFKNYKENYLAYPTSQGSRSLCILISKETTPKQVSLLHESDTKNKIVAYRKYTVKWERVWPVSPP